MALIVLIAYLILFFQFLWFFKASNQIIDSYKQKVHIKISLFAIFQVL
jgi:hypothetical protein